MTAAEIVQLISCGGQRLHRKEYKIVTKYYITVLLVQALSNNVRSLSLKFQVNILNRTGDITF